MDLKLISSCVLSLSLIGCSQLTQQPQSKHQSTPPTDKKTTSHSHSNGVQITPYQVPEIKRESIPVKNILPLHNQQQLQMVQKNLFFVS